MIYEKKRNLWARNAGEARVGASDRSTLTSASKVRILFEELHPSASSGGYTRVTEKRRESPLSAFRLFRLSRNGFRHAAGLSKTLRFARDASGSERNHDYSPRTPRFCRPNSLALWLPSLSELPTRFLSDGERNEFARRVNALPAYA